MEYIYIGFITNTHGIKGELRILSDFRYKELIFLKDYKLYIGDKKELYIINQYRKHKNYDMVIFNGINIIEQVLKYKGSKVYINKDDFKLEKNSILDEEIIGCDVYEDNMYIGKVVDIMKISPNNILVIMNNNKKILIPYIKEFIKEIDVNNNRLNIKSIEGMI